MTSLGRRCTFVSIDATGQMTQMDYSNVRKWLSNWGGIILLVFTLLPFLILSFYNHPSLDDYLFTDIEHQKGFLEAQKYWYLNWSGRYFSVALLSLNPLVFNAYWGYKLNAFLLLIFLLISSYWLTGKLFKSLSRSEKIGLASLFIFSYIMLLPRIATAIYWQNTSYQSLLSGILTLFLLGCTISYYSSDNKKQYFILSCLLLVAIIGCYEISMVFIDLAILLVAFLNIVKKRNLVFPLTLAGICIIFSLIEIGAPGNNNRQMLMYSGSAHKFAYSIRETLINGKDLLILWLPLMLLTGILLFKIPSKRLIWSDKTDHVFSIPLWFSLLACLSIPFIGLFIVYWAMGCYAPPRALDVVYFYFILGMMYFLLSCLVWIRKRYPLFRLPAFINILLIVGLITVLYFNKTISSKNNIVAAYNDILSGKASAYNNERIKENDFLINYKGDSCRIDSIENFPVTLFFTQLPQAVGADDTWDILINNSFYHYYHKKYIGIK